MLERVGVRNQGMANVTCFAVLHRKSLPGSPKRCKSRRREGKEKEERLATTENYKSQHSLRKITTGLSRFYSPDPGDLSGACSPDSAGEGVGRVEAVGKIGSS